MPDTQHPIAKIDELVRRLESVRDPAARAAGTELVQAVLELHAAALGRALEILSPEDIAGLAADDLVSSILALHGLHPDDMDTRIQRAIDKLQRHFDSRGAGISLSAIDGGVVRVRFAGSRRGSGAAAKQVIEDVIYEAAPEIAGLVIDGVEQPRAPGFVPLSDLVAAQPL